MSKNRRYSRNSGVSVNGVKEDSMENIPNEATDGDEKEGSSVVLSNETSLSEAVENLRPNETLMETDNAEVGSTLDDAETPVVEMEPMPITQEDSSPEDLKETKIEKKDVIVEEHIEEKLDIELKSVDTPLINPAQNLTSDANIKSWEVRDPSNVLRPILENIFTEYEKNMRPKKPIDRNKGGEYQTTLYQTIIRVAQSRTHFNENWNYILSRFQENPNKVYDINYVMRFLDTMSVTKADTVLFPRLLNLIIHTSDRTKIVENLRRVSLEKTLSTVSSNAIRTNILGYYRQYVA